MNYPEKDTQAERLEAILLHRIAKPLRTCGQRIFGFCNQRMCPSCAFYKARKERVQMRAKMMRLSEPQECILVLRSSGIGDLSKTWSRFTTHLQKLKRWYSARCKRAGREVRAVGQIEPKLSGSGQVWSLHIHLVLEIDEEIKPALKEEWLRLTQAKNAIQAECVWGEPIKDIEASVHYLTKLDWRCPDAGELEDDVLEAFVDAIRGRRHAISWGFRRSPKKPSAIRDEQTTGEPAPADPI